ncbi:hypothetical protein, partial [Moorena sp. SIO4G3]|uniref:hypothetical protein n=1 Tax=Moorena sp. SIO4G3 TaxID=2607821 RepID=UPI00142CE01C
PSGLFSITEANAASSIANTLNEIQFENGQKLVTTILNGGDYQATELLRDIGGSPGLVVIT